MYIRQGKLCAHTSSPTIELTNHFHAIWLILIIGHQLRADNYWRFKKSSIHFYSLNYLILLIEQIFMKYLHLPVTKYLLCPRQLCECSINIKSGLPNNPMG